MTMQAGEAVQEVEAVGSAGFRRIVVGCSARQFEYGMCRSGTAGVVQQECYSSRYDDAQRLRGCRV